MFAGCVSDEQLKAYYLRGRFLHAQPASTRVSASARRSDVDEGAGNRVRFFCNSADGRQGRIVWQERNPYLLAESINYLDHDESVSAALGLMGRKRYEEHFTNKRIASSISAACSSESVDMDKVAIVVQRCHESMVGGSESLAWHYAMLLKR